VPSSPEEDSGERSASPGSVRAEISPLSPREQAKGRQRAYELLGRLFERGADDGVLPVIEASSELAAAYGESLRELGVADAEPQAQLDALAAEHHRIFSREIYPFGGVFCDDSVLVGAGSDELIALYQRAQYDDWQKADASDHISTVLAFASYLSAQQAYALEMGAGQSRDLFESASADIDGPVLIEESVGGWASLSRELFEDHLLSWLPTLLIAIDRDGSAFYRAVGRLSLAVVSDHYRELCELLALSDVRDARQEASAVEPPPDLQSDETSLSDIVDFLLAPRRSGIFFGLGDITALGRRFKIPRGFGSRKQSLMTLFRSAADYELSAVLTEALQKQCGEWIARYAALIAQHEHLADFLEPALQRARVTHALAATIAERVAKEASAEDEQQQGAQR
jgi:TorA maturation chaperone TorD